ncbi:hypothetical protein [Salinibacter phage 5_9]
MRYLVVNTLQAITYVLLHRRAGLYPLPVHPNRCPCASDCPPPIYANNGFGLLMLRVKLKGIVKEYIVPFDLHLATLWGTLPKKAVHVPPATLNGK